MPARSLVRVPRAVRSCRSGVTVPAATAAAPSAPRTAPSARCPALRRCQDLPGPHVNDSPSTPGSCRRRAHGQVSDPQHGLRPGLPVLADPELDVLPTISDAEILLGRGWLHAGRPPRPGANTVDRVGDRLDSLSCAR